MSDTLVGGLLALAGTALGIVGGVIVGRLAAREEQRRRRRDYEIGQIATTMRILDLWQRAALTVLSGDDVGREAARKALDESDQDWDWDPKLIPGGVELRSLASSVWMVPPRDNDERLAVLNQLIEMQGQVRADASRRTRELQ